MKNARAKRAKILFFHCQICQFVGFLLPSSSWLQLKLPVVEVEVDVQLDVQVEVQVQVQVEVEVVVVVVVVEAGLWLEGYVQDLR